MGFKPAKQRKAEKRAKRKRKTWNRFPGIWDIDKECFVETARWSVKANGISIKCVATTRS